jgi:hypothetical protein
MAENGFTGCIPSCLGNISSLGILDLSNIQSSTIKLEQLTTIMFLKLSNNNLDGQILTSVFNSSGLYFLYLSGNNFWGQIPDFPPPSWKIFEFPWHKTGEYLNFHFNNWYYQHHTEDDEQENWPDHAWILKTHFMIKRTLKMLLTYVKCWHVSI